MFLALRLKSAHKSVAYCFIQVMSDGSLTLSVPNVVCIFYYNKLSFGKTLYVKLKDWMSNSVDLEATAHWAVSSGYMLFAKANIIAFGSETINNGQRLILKSPYSSKIGILLSKKG